MIIMSLTSLRSILEVQILNLDKPHLSAEHMQEMEEIREEPEEEREGPFNIWGILG